MQSTQNYQLVQQERTDPADIEQIKENWSIIDAEMKRLSDEKFNKAGGTITGETTFNEDIFIKGQSNSKTLLTSGNAAFGGTTTSNGKLVANAGATVKGGTTTDTLTATTANVTGTTTLAQTNVGKGLTVKGGVLADATTVSGNANVQGTLTATGRILANGGVTASGATVTRDFNVEGATALKGGVTVTGVTTTDSLTVGGRITVNGGVTTKGLTVEGNVEVLGGSSLSAVDVNGQLHAKKGFLNTLPYLGEFTTADALNAKLLENFNSLPDSTSKSFCFNNNITGGYGAFIAGQRMSVTISKLSSAGHGLMVFHAYHSSGSTGFIQINDGRMYHSAPTLYKDTYEAEITSGSDLNTYTAVGSFLVYSNEVARTIKNIPLQVAGRLDVQETGAGIVQIFTAYDVDQMGIFVRKLYRYENRWGSWREQASLVDGSMYFDSARVYFDTGANTLGFGMLIGNTWGEKGAALSLKHMDATSNGGAFFLTASDGKGHQSNLLGEPSGTLQWQNKNVVRSVNNITANEAGNVTIPTASASQYGLVKTATPDVVLTDANDAAITPAVYHDVSDFRHKNTTYAVGDKVECMFNHELWLECTVGGTTAATPLDTRNVTHGQVLTDGTVQWTVRTHIVTVNGQKPDALGNIEFVQDVGAVSPDTMTGTGIYRCETTINSVAGQWMVTVFADKRNPNGITQVAYPIADNQGPTFTRNGTVSTDGALTMGSWTSGGGGINLKVWAE